MPATALLERFTDEGWIRVRRAFDADEAAAMRDTVWRHVEHRNSVRLADPATWSEAAGASFGFRALEGRPVFAPVVHNPRVQHALDAIFGVGCWQRPATPRPQILLTFPRPAPWVMPNGWHIDFGDERPTWPVFAVKLFAFFDDVAPKGGGTLLLAGSHRLVERMNASAPQCSSPTSPHDRLLAGDAWLAELREGGSPHDTRRHMIGRRHLVDGVSLRVTELVGRAGDVVITHMQVLHAPAPNTSDRPRQMFGMEILRTE